jgi:rhodanese-related sulfurtransferase
MFFPRRKEITWPDILARIGREFPQVRQITTAELAAWLERSDDGHPVLLDVRGGDEFAVSHLSGARHVLPDSDPKRELADLPRDQLVVAYCAAGVRSCRYLVKMSGAGFTNLANLEGAIFQWTNDGLPLEAAGQPAKLVHACDKNWGALLREDLRVLPD